MVVIPHILEPHISKVVEKEALLPCHKVYIDCALLVAETALNKKVWGFYNLASAALHIPRESGMTIDNVDMFAIQRLFKLPTHYTIITIDEYQMLLANLPPLAQTHIAVHLRNIMLDHNSACQFIVTGSTGAALMSSLEESIQNGISVFKAAGIVSTDLHSSSDDLADVHMLLTHHNLASGPSPSSAIQNGLGYVNCAAVNVVSGEYQTMAGGFLTFSHVLFHFQA
jgi:hypothetical protein